MCHISGDTLVCGSDDGCLVAGEAGPELGLTQLRHGVQGFLASSEESAVADAVLVVYELAANATHHGQPPVHVRLERRQGRQRLWAMVSDASTEPPQKRSSGGGGGGYGLMVVEGFALAWGVVPGPSGKTVWAELPLVVE